jgi:hypothetical protein
MKLQGRPTFTRALHKSERKLYVEMTFAIVKNDAGDEGQERNRARSARAQAECERLHTHWRTRSSRRTILNLFAPAASLQRRSSQSVLCLRRKYDLVGARAELDIRSEERLELRRYRFAIVPDSQLARWQAGFLTCRQMRVTSPARTRFDAGPSAGRR